MDIIIAGDLVPTESNMEEFATGDIDRLLGEKLRCEWEKARIKIFNLEVPLADMLNPIAKRGPNLSAHEKTIVGIKALNPSLVTLANNHILDQGDEGLYSTINILKTNGIPYVGAGKDINEARKPYFFDELGYRIGVYACCEHEFSVSNEKKPGANPFDPFESLDHIVEAKSNSDYLIVLFHGGKELYQFPTPGLQKICRKMVEKGADLVICQHSHCIGCLEKFRDSTIIYGQGNFLFDYSDSEYWSTSLLVCVDFDNKERISFIPIVKIKNGVRIPKERETITILGQFEERSNMIIRPGFIEENFGAIVQQEKEAYIGRLVYGNRWLRLFDKKILKNKLLNAKLNKNKIHTMYNLIACETHREILLEALKKNNFWR